MNGFERLKPSEVEAMDRMMGWDLRPHEVEAILDLDDAMFPPAKAEPRKNARSRKVDG